jgi:YesN/AraC family two-component response regulator
MKSKLEKKMKKEAAVKGFLKWVGRGLTGKGFGRLPSVPTTRAAAQAQRAAKAAKKTRKMKPSAWQLESQKAPMAKAPPKPAKPAVPDRAKALREKEMAAHRKRLDHERAMRKQRKQRAAEYKLQQEGKLPEKKKRKAPVTHLLRRH